MNKTASGALQVVSGDAEMAHEQVKTKATILC